MIFEFSTKIQRINKKTKFFEMFFIFGKKSFFSIFKLITEKIILRKSDILLFCHEKVKYNFQNRHFQ